MQRYPHTSTRALLFGPRFSQVTGLSPPCRQKVRRQTLRACEQEPGRPQRVDGLVGRAGRATCPWGRGPRAAAPSAWPCTMHAWHGVPLLRSSGSPLRAAGRVMSAGYIVIQLAARGYLASASQHTLHTYWRLPASFTASTPYEQPASPQTAVPVITTLNDADRQSRSRSA